MVGLAAAGLVVLLEVINVAGTWVWLTDTRRHVRLEAAVGVGVASLGTGACGFLTYGLIGAVAPAGLLFAVHLTFRLNQRPAVLPRVVQRVRIVPAPVPAQDDQRDEDGTQDAPDTEPVPLSSVPTAEDEDVITALVARDGRVPGIGTIAREHSIGKDKAARCKREAERRRGEAA
jgi:hypothetical protein